MTDRITSPSSRTTSMTELVRKLRDLAERFGKCRDQTLCIEAANAIESLTGEGDLGEPPATRSLEVTSALEPFADVSGEDDEDFPDDTKVVCKFGRSTYYALTLGDFRRAARALQAASAAAPPNSPQANIQR